MSNLSPESSSQPLRVLKCDAQDDADRSSVPVPPLPPVGRDYTEGLEAMRNEWKATLRTYDQAMQYTACLVVARSVDAQELHDQLVMLRKTAFYTRYGVIFAEVCTKLKTEAE